ncbi:hypothetical protein Poli38472_009411 [Pythium oligandrum]|uniref:MI domain-containing protein n=1 Tax=Pythium oligandrum TaxID=41045 RepID=A0A8K1CKK5_PYTOL|nr:hypothetical protein Poli38472_009411 [Pythium oligandrum]|eukprot:TMW65244.1 hypothetical protein Poli38472_009411 [Pythium oligandrum]
MPASAPTRKEKRKLERQEKKQRKNKKQRATAVEAPVSRSKTFKQSGQKRPATTKRANGGGPFQNKFHELVQETTGRSMRRTEPEEEETTEDAEIKALESKLGLNSTSVKKDGAKRLQREYIKDGLGEDFTDFLSSLDNISKMVKERKKEQPASRRPPPPSREEESEDEEEDDEAMSDEDDDGRDFGSDMEMDEETRRELELLQQEDAEFLKGMDELPTDESDLDSDEDLAAFESEDDEDDEDDDEVQQNTLRNAQAAAAGSGSEVEYDEEDEDEGEEADDDAEPDAEEDEEEEKEEAVIKEDIYGRPVLESRDGPKKPSAYIPPHLRRQMMNASQEASDTSNKNLPLSSTMDEQALRELTRRVNGQLNRISESNMESIALEMEKIYREHGRSIVNAILLDKLLQTSCHPRQIMTPLIKVGGALVAALYHSVGSEIGGFFIEKFVLKLVESVDKLKAAAQDASNTGDDDEENDLTASKEPANLLLLVAMLYNFGVVQCTLIYDLFRRFVDQFSVVEIELIHQLLKSCGHQLRSDDSDALKEMVASVQQKVTSMNENGNGQSDDRVRFILDLIYDLKKPSKQKKHAAAAAGGLNAMSAAFDLTSLKKWLGRVKTRCGNANNPLRISLHELMNADQDGRWWIVGGTWVGYQQKKESNDGADNDNARQQEENRLLKLAEKQRMNTDVRRRIFVAIMGATDCLDAYERLLQLHLKEKQEREIVRVVMHCCGQEKKFNRYYLVLSQKLCEMDQRYKFTYQLAFWDAFKQMETCKPRKLYNMAQLLAGMIISGALSLSCLKVLDFTSLDEKTVLFLRIVMEKIMKLEDELEMAQVFQRLLQTKKAQLTIDGLAVFLHQHLTSFKTEEDPATRQLLKQRSKSIKSLLDALAKSAATSEAMSDFM